MGKLMVDSWAWVEYLRGGELGRRAKTEMERNNEVFTHVVTVAELISKFSRELLNPDGAWTAVVSSSKIVIPNAVDAKDVGLLHASMKEKRPNFSLADAFVLYAARKLKGKVLTGDPDFRGVKEAVMLK